MTNEVAPLIVISIVNWNTAEATLRCLRSLHVSTYENFQIVVVDNSSCDGSVERIQFSFPTVTVLSTSENVGFAAGHHLAYSQAMLSGAAAVWLVNSDAEVEPDALTCLVAAWQRCGEAVYGGVPLVRDTAGTVWLNFPQKYLLESGRPRAFQRDHAIKFDQNWAERLPFMVGAVPGSTLFLPLTLVASVGWLDNGWFLYCEEIDYCYRLRTLGVPRILVPKSKVWHHGGGSHKFSPAVTDCIAYYRTRNEIAIAQRYSSASTMALTVVKKIVRAAYVCLNRPQRARLILLGLRHAVCGQVGKTLAPECYLQRDRL